MFPKSTFSFHSYPSPNLPCTEATVILPKPNASYIKYSSLLHIYFLKGSSLSIRLSPSSLVCQRSSMIWSFPAFPNLIFHHILTFTFCFCSHCLIYVELFPDCPHLLLLPCATLFNNVCSLITDFLVFGAPWLFNPATQILYSLNYGFPCISTPSTRHATEYKFSNFLNE